MTCQSRYSHVFAASPPPLLAGTTLRVLPNGLRLLVREQHGAPLVAIDAWVRAGSGAEEMGEDGAAHFLEHLLFKGTPTRKPGEIDAAIEDMGAALAAGTTRDAAHFYTTVPSMHVEIALDVIADALQNSILPAEETERERAVILDELARSRNDIARQATNRLFAELTPKHAFARPVLGEPESIKSLSRERVVKFYRRWYVPNNVTLVIVGDTTPEKAGELVLAAFGKWASARLPAHAGPGEPEPLPAKTKPAPAALRALSATAAALPSGRQHVSVAFRLGPMKDLADIATAMIAAVLLGDPEIGRIAGALREPVEKPVRPAAVRSAAHPRQAGAWASEVEGDYMPQAGPSLLKLSAQVQEGRAENLRSLITIEIERLQKEPPSAEDLDFARRRNIGPYLYNVETYAGQARALGEYDILGDYTIARRLIDQLFAIKPADISAFARKWLTADRRADLILNPQDKR